MPSRVRRCPSGGCRKCFSFNIWRQEKLAKFSRQSSTSRQLLRCLSQLSTATVGMRACGAQDAIPRVTPWLPRRFPTVTTPSLRRRPPPRIDTLQCNEGVVEIGRFQNLKNVIDPTRVNDPAPATPNRLRQSGTFRIFARSPGPAHTNKQGSPLFARVQPPPRRELARQRPAVVLDCEHLGLGSSAARTIMCWIGP